MTCQETSHPVELDDGDLRNSADARTGVDTLGGLSGTSSNTSVDSNSPLYSVTSSMQERKAWGTPPKSA